MSDAKHGCPFCGSQPKVVEGKLNKRWSVFCPVEDGSCPMYIELDDWYDSAEAASVAWDEAMELVVMHTKKVWVDTDQAEVEPVEEHHR